jgi:ribokinase
MLATGSGKTISVPAFEVQAVDTTAAGDAFMGAFAVALAEGMTAHDALGWGNAAGALAVTTVGAQPSLPSRAELEAVYKLPRRL